ncbi:MAG: dUTP diphosphatase [Candidatus Marinimicrobia bacterium]|jgi:dUTP pyrophosphatase|nr:dUTP diphosphatase [Candidatus Neomarinimicrobiota bacterium]MDP6726254.1 dUTP diphosphatase [Candidatus Neomarinimicrobiota bacterium]|tara:strand:- start:60533 stop:60970 length:438 start_codon:yes stop_codon:yes gene_type:complete
MNLKIKPFNTVVKELYDNHGHFHDGDAGIDLFVINEQTIKAGESTFIHLQIACENTENKPYLVMPRSSIAKTPLRLSNSIGLIDGGYRGEIMAAVDNIKNEDYTVEPGQRLFQLVAMDGSPIHFELVDDLSDTTRGSGGFGSTGK